jgi:hypothetical protein
MEIAPFSVNYHLNANSFESGKEVSDDGTKIRKIDIIRAQKKMVRSESWKSLGIDESTSLSSIPSLSAIPPFAEKPFSSPAFGSAFNIPSAVSDSTSVVSARSRYSSKERDEDILKEIEIIKNENDFKMNESNILKTSPSVSKHIKSSSGNFPRLDSATSITSYISMSSSSSKDFLDSDNSNGNENVNEKKKLKQEKKNKTKLEKLPERIRIAFSKERMGVKSSFEVITENK